MARIVLGLGSSHTPQLSTTIDWWDDHAARDRRNPFLIGRDGEVHNYDDLVASPQWVIGRERLTAEVWASLHARAQAAVAALSSELAAAAPDVVVVVGDDQEEMFRDDGMPTFAVYYGDSIYDMPPEEERKAAMPDSLRAALWAAHSDVVEKYLVPADLGRHVITEMLLDEFDVTALSRQPSGRSIGHAFTFVRRRLMGETMIPLLPIALNAYNPPNQPSPRRCYLFGRALRRAIESYPEDLTVAIVASGGLSHFVVDEELDQRILTGLRNRDMDVLATVPRKFMRSGSSETLNWIAAGGALEGLSMELKDYIPAYRSEAGTGVGMAFAVWK
jgi:3-O-methylgallate 3,4-dioxygenase